MKIQEHSGKLTTLATAVTLLAGAYTIDSFYARATTVEDVETKVVAVEGQVKIVNRHMFNLLQVLKTQWITRKTVLEFRKQQGDNLTPTEKVELKNVTELLETLSQEKSGTGTVSQ